MQTFNPCFNPLGDEFPKIPFYLRHLGNVYAKYNGHVLTLYTG